MSGSDRPRPDEADLATQLRSRKEGEDILTFIQTNARKLALVAAFAVALGFAACSDGGTDEEERQAAPAPVKQQASPMVDMQTEETPSVLDLIATRALVSQHSDNAVSIAGAVMGCDASAERQVESAQEARDGAVEAAEELQRQVVLYLDDPDTRLEEAGPANDLLEEANEFVQKAEVAVRTIGSCGPATDEEIEIMFMRGQPGKGEDIIIFYGQARSIVRWLVRRYGPNRLTEFLSYIKRGDDLDQAFTNAYEGDRVVMTNLWRNAIGAKEYAPPSNDQARPTAVSQPTLGLFSLTPQAGVQTVGSQQAESTPTATPKPAPTPTPIELSSNVDDAPSPMPDPAQGMDDTEDTTAPAPGSSCFAPLHPTGAVDLTSAAFVVGIAILGIRRRFARP